ncbi:MAG: hypothetical protein Q8R24_09080 [Legionellaceae bacterium]|nr:hypothetical protein [Legionellaceae bacterium]
MNKRLVWNFEINSEKPLEIDDMASTIASLSLTSDCTLGLSEQVKDSETTTESEKTTLDNATELTWESRFFWQEHEIVVLNGLNQAFLDLSHYQIKHKTDEYFLLPQLPYNLKLRRNCLYYKPLMIRTPTKFAYGKKINLHEQKEDMRLIGTDQLTVKNILSQIDNQSRRVLVEKEALSYQLQTTPTTQLELARLSFDKTIYFSVCIESSSRTLVESITPQLIPHRKASDYVSFLQQAL